MHHLLSGSKRYKVLVFNDFVEIETSVNFLAFAIWNSLDQIDFSLPTVPKIRNGIKEK